MSETDSVAAPVFHHLVLGSGGLSGLAYLGVLRFIQEHTNDLNAGWTHLKHYYGVSIGAFFGFLFASGIRHDAIEEELKKTYGVPDATYCPYESVAQLQSNYGLDDGKRLVAPLKNLYRRHYNKAFPKQSYDIESLTFLDFAKQSGRTLTVVATNCNTQKPVFFSVVHTPHQCIWDALQASMTIPGLFQPVQINDDLYVDGYISCVYPVPATLTLPLAHTLSIYMPMNTTTSSGPTPRHPLPTFMEFFKSILTMVAFYNHEFLRMLPNQPYTLLLPNPPVAPFPIQMEKEGFYVAVSPEEIDASIAYGYEKIYDFYNARISRSPAISSESNGLT